MKTKNIIRDALLFLEKEFHLEFQLIEERGNYYIYKNKFGRFEYYEWSQFQEAEFRVNANDECKTIDMLFIDPKKMGVYQKKNKGLRGFSRDGREEYWKIVANIIRSEIEKNNSLFGLRLV